LGLGGGFGDDLDGGFFLEAGLKLVGGEGAERRLFNQRGSIWKGLHGGEDLDMGLFGFDGLPVLAKARFELLEGVEFLGLLKLCCLGGIGTDR
jgi:hypothetical protein